MYGLGDQKGIRGPKRGRTYNLNIGGPKRGRTYNLNIDTL